MTRGMQIAEEIKSGRCLKITIFGWGQVPTVLEASYAEACTSTLLPMAAREAVLALFADKASVQRMVIDAHPESMGFSQIVIEWAGKGDIHVL